MDGPWASSILESVFQNAEGAFGLVDPEFRLVAFNRQFVEDYHRVSGQVPVAGEIIYSDFPAETIRQRHALLHRVLRGDRETIEGDLLFGKERVYYRTSFNPVRVNGEVTGILINSNNLTAMQEGKQEIRKLSRIHQFTSQINEMIGRTFDEATLLAESCRIAIQHGNFRFAWAGPHDAQSGWITPATWAGHEAGYLKGRRFSSLHRPEGSGSCGHAVRSRAAVCCNDAASDALMEFWRDEALSRGYRSSISFPLFAGGEVVSVLGLYTGEPHFFNEAEIQLLKEVTDNISFALDNIRLRASEEEKFRTLVERSQVGVYILQDNKFVYVNPWIEQISGYTAAEMIAMKDFGQIIHREDREFANDKYASRISGDVEKDDFVLKVHRKDGSVAHIRVLVSSIIYRNRPAALGSVLDITDRLLEDNRINKAVIDAQETERMQIGMELHDNIQQIIAGAIMNLNYVLSSFDDREEALKVLREIKRYLSDSMLELRRVSHQLAPSLRWDHDLAQDIRRLVEAMHIGRFAEVRLDIDRLDEPLGQHLQLAIYRILQEQLTNITKYAEASQVTIRLQASGRRILLSVKDNGKGFDATIKKPGIGLENIRRRVATFDGEMKIVSSPGHGCELLLQVPLP
jgi:PAS domain S-box-containing protein